jgi:replication factor C subunit 3/5
MSDIEDEMDVDAPVADNSITFGGDTKKGKRSAANLPVEAEDSLPWYVAGSGQVRSIAHDS